MRIYYGFALLLSITTMLEAMEVMMGELGGLVYSTVVEEAKKPGECRMCGALKTEKPLTVLGGNALYTAVGHITQNESEFYVHNFWLSPRDHVVSRLDLPLSERTELHEMVLCTAAILRRVFERKVKVTWSENEGSHIQVWFNPFPELRGGDADSSSIREKLEMPFLRLVAKVAQKGWSLAAGDIDSICDKSENS